MSDNEEQFPQRWGFRRKDSDVDSSSDDQSRPSYVSGPKRKRHKLATRLFPGENDRQILHSPQLHPGGKNHSSHDEPSKELINSRKRQERKSTMKTDTKVSYNESSNGSFNNLREYMKCLVEGVKVAREDLLKWMNIEIEKSYKDDKTSKPAKKEQKRGIKEAQESNPKRSRTPISNRNKARKTSGTVTQNSKDGSSDKVAVETKISHETSKIVVPVNKPDGNVVSGSTAVQKNQKQKTKGKKLGSSASKQKTPKGNQQTDEASEAPIISASTHQTLPTVLLGLEAVNREKTHSGGGNGERDTWSKKDSMISQAMNFTPRFQQGDGMFGQNGLRNFGDYAQNTLPTNGNIRMTGNENENENGRGNGFPFSFPSQGLNGGIGMPRSNFPNQFGLQYLSQEGILAGLRMNGGPPIMSSGNHSFNGSYGTYNQQLRMEGHGGLVPLQTPDNIRSENLQSR